MKRTPLKRKTPLKSKGKLNPARRRKCRICKAWFNPRSTTQVVCGKVPCAAEYGRQQEKKRQRRELRAMRDGLKRYPELLADAQKAFNAYIRARDDGLPCISCSRNHLADPTTGGAWDCGHYLTVGAHPELRFEPTNAARQCKGCNRIRGTTRRQHRLGMIDRFGIAKVEWLEGQHSPRKYTREELRSIRDGFRQAEKEAKRFG